MTVNIYSNLPGDEFNSEELRLFNLVNQYRNQNGLPSIQASKALSIVANRHVWDLAENIGSLTHAWSDAPYDSNDPNTYSSMWDAPQRFNTGYPGYGFENGFGSSHPGYIATADAALQAWKTSASHNEVILNQGRWGNHTWNALGIGIYKGYAVIWFGEEVDSTGTPFGSPNPPVFDPLQYGASHPDLIAALGSNVQALTDHYNNIGRFEGRSMDKFNELGYVASYSDLIQAFGLDTNAATRHYIEYGYYEGRTTSLFKEDIYLASYGDLIQAFGYNLDQAAQHYITSGAREGRATNLFDPVEYLNNYGDLRLAFNHDLGAATRHYIEFGYYEGRSFN